MDAPRVIRILFAAIAGVLLCWLIWKRRDWLDFIRLIYVFLVLGFYFVRMFFYPRPGVLNQLATYNGIYAVGVVLAYCITEIVTLNRKSH